MYWTCIKWYKSRDFMDIEIDTDIMKGDECIVLIYSMYKCHIMSMCAPTFQQPVNPSMFSFCLLGNSTTLLQNSHQQSVHWNLGTSNTGPAWKNVQHLITGPCFQKVR